MFICILNKYALVVRGVSYCPHPCHPACVCLSIDLYAYLHVAVTSMLIYVYVYATTMCSQLCLGLGTCRHIPTKGSIWHLLSTVNKVYLLLLWFLIFSLHLGSHGSHSPLALLLGPHNNS